VVGVSSIAFLGSYGIDVEKFNKIDGMVGVMQTYYAGETAAEKGGMETAQRNNRAKLVQKSRQRPQEDRL
jgi:hypothetical protein